MRATGFRGCSRAHGIGWTFNGDEPILHESWIRAGCGMVKERAQARTIFLRIDVAVFFLQDTPYGKI